MFECVSLHVLVYPGGAAGEIASGAQVEDGRSDRAGENGRRENSVLEVAAAGA